MEEIREIQSTQNKELLRKAFEAGQKHCNYCVDKYDNRPPDFEQWYKENGSKDGKKQICKECGYPMFYFKPDDMMYCHGCNNAQPT